MQVKLRNLLPVYNFTCRLLNSNLFLHYAKVNTFKAVIKHQKNIKSEFISHFLASFHELFTSLNHKSRNKMISWLEKKPKDSPMPHKSYAEWCDKR